MQNNCITSGVTRLLFGILLTCIAASPLMGQDWPIFGQNLANTASTTQTDISTSNVYKLMPKWIFTTGGDVSARATVVHGVVYFPDWGGNVWALNASNGRKIWGHKISDYGLATGTVSRTSPTIANGVLYIGTQYASPGPTGWLLAINAATGALMWKVQPDTSNIFPVITGSPVVAGGKVFVGMTSNEEYAAADPSYPCCSVRGSVVALDASSGAKLWQTFTVPAGYSGAAVWGSNMVADTARNTLFFGTGDNYSHPIDPVFEACSGSGFAEAECLSPFDYVDAIVAVDMSTGAVKWANRLVYWDQRQYGVIDGSDDWNVGCVFGPGTNCPHNPTGPDYDFASAPNEITYQTPSGPKTIIGAGQKSGIYYALDPDTGALLWQTQVGPGSSLGGMEWGSASDGARIYVAIANLYGIPYSTGFAGSWAALDPATGRILWQTADPSGGMGLGPVAVANGVVYAPSTAGLSGQPSMLALDAATGNILWEFGAGASVNAGATIVKDTVYWGSGYTHLPIPGLTGNNKFYAFTPNGT